MVLGARKTCCCRRTIGSRQLEPSSLHFRFEASGEELGFRFDVVLGRSSEFAAGALLKVNENERRPAIQWCGREFAGLGLQACRFKVSQRQENGSSRSARGPQTQEFDTALQLRPEFRLQDLRLGSLLQLDATKLQQSQRFGRTRRQ